MPTVLAFIEHNGAELRGSALSAITAARRLAEQSGAAVTLLVLGKGAAAVAEKARLYAPRVRFVADAALDAPLAETWAAAVVAAVAAEGAVAVLATATATGKDVLPRAAALLDAGMASDVSALLGRARFQRPILAGAAVATVEVSTPLVVVTTRQTEFPAATPLPAPGVAEPLTVPGATAGRAEWLGQSLTQSARPELTEAKIVVSGGRGLKSAENFKAVEALADLLGGAVGASRAATDAGYAPADWQVGQTGKVVAPDLYVAVGISGAIQHLAGMKSSRVIVAVNKDPEAPIFQVADYGLVSTWEKTLPELSAAIREIKK